MKLKSIFAAAVVTAGVFAGSVQASPVWTVSAHGTISHGYDYTGVFGTANQSLVGLEYTQTITASVDPNQHAYKYNGGNVAYMYGYNNPFTDTVTVGGKTISFNISNSAFAEQYIADGAKTGGYDEIYTYDYGYDSKNTNYVYVNNYAYTNGKNTDFVPTLDFGQTINKTIGPGVIAASNFSVSSHGVTYANFSTTPDSITVNGNDVSANVPEPASIALLGLGLLGMTALRRRKSS